MARTGEDGALHSDTWLRVLRVESSELDGFGVERLQGLITSAETTEGRLWEAGKGLRIDV